MVRLVTCASSAHTNGCRCLLLPAFLFFLVPAAAAPARLCILVNGSLSNPGAMFLPVWPGGTMMLCLGVVSLLPPLPVTTLFSKMLCSSDSVLRVSTFAPLLAAGGGRCRMKRAWSDIVFCGWAVNCGAGLYQHCAM